MTPLAPLQGGANGLLDMIRACGGEEQGFRSSAPAVVGAAQQQLADALRALAAAGLARDEHVKAALGQRFGKRLHLRRLADPLPAFERDELAAAHAMPNSDLSPSHTRVKNPAPRHPRLRPGAPPAAACRL